MKIGCIGLGKMGAGVCKNLIAKEYEVYVFDLNTSTAKSFAEKAEVVESVELMIKNCDLVFLSLPSSLEVEKITDTFLSIGVKDKIVIDLSTSFPLSSQTIYRKFKENGGSFADASLTGSPAQAESGELIVTFGGDEELFHKVKGAVKSFAKSFHYIGDSGSGNLAKLANNYLAIMYVALYAEIFPMIDKLGIDSKRLFEIIGDSAVGCRMYQAAASKIVEQTYTKAFSVELALKDLNYVKRLFEESDAPSLLLDGGLDMLKRSVEKDFAEQDLTAMAKIQRERIGLKN